MIKILIFCLMSNFSSNYWDEWQDKKTYHVEEHEGFPNKEQMWQIRRIKYGIVRAKQKYGWYECGKKVDDIDTLATKYAFLIVKSAWEHSTEDYVLNSWGLLGTAWNESKLDRCALGLHPREFAYKHKILKKSKLTISHSEEEIIMAINHPKMKRAFSKTGVDVGVFQLLQEFYSVFDLKTILQREFAVSDAAREMARRAKKWRTKKPWFVWPGHKSKKYGAKIRRKALYLGATKNEI